MTISLGDFTELGLVGIRYTNVPIPATSRVRLNFFFDQKIFIVKSVKGRACVYKFECLLFMKKN